MKFLTTLLLLVMMTGQCFAQGGKDSGVWDFIEGETEFYDSVVMVHGQKTKWFEDEQLWGTINFTGTGAVVAVDKTKKIRDGYQGIVLTAYHVVEENVADGKLKIEFDSGKKSNNCTVLAYDGDADIAFVWCWIPKGVEPIPISGAALQPGEYFELIGYGGRSNMEEPPRHFGGIAHHITRPEKIQSDESVMGGDSGGPCLNVDGEIVGVCINGGEGWPVEDKTLAHWPSRYAGIESIKALQMKLPDWFK